MRVIIESDGKSKAQLLQLKPVDLYSAFDMNVTKKKWEKNHENSWSLLIWAKNPSNNKRNKMTIKLSRIPQVNNDVVVQEITVDNNKYPSEHIAQEMVRLDNAYFSR